MDSPWGLKESDTTSDFHFASLSGDAECRGMHSTLLLLPTSAFAPKSGSWVFWFLSILFLIRLSFGLAGSSVLRPSFLYLQRAGTPL